MKRFFIFLLLTFSSVYSLAERQNYYGVVTRVAFLDNQGSFVVTVDTNELDDCKFKYAFFLADKVGQDRVKMAYSMALTSLTTKMKMNLVIDKQNKGTGGECYVDGMVSGIQSY